MPFFWMRTLVSEPSVIFVDGLEDDEHDIIDLLLHVARQGATVVCAFRHCSFKYG